MPDSLPVSLASRPGVEPSHQSIELLNIRDTILVLEIEYHPLANMVSKRVRVVILGQWLPSLGSSTVLVTMSLLSIPREYFQRVSEQRHRSPYCLSYTTITSSLTVTALPPRCGQARGKTKQNQTPISSLDTINPRSSASLPTSAM